MTSIKKSQMLAVISDSLKNFELVARSDSFDEAYLRSEGTLIRHTSIRTSGADLDRKSKHKSKRKSKRQAQRKARRLNRN